MHRILIIGVGSIGERHLRTFKATNRAELCLCETGEQLRRTVADRYGVTRVFANLDEALGDRCFDAAVVCVPSHLHIPMARQLVDAAEVDALPPIDRLRVRLDRLLGRIRGAMQGYSGFFDLVRVDESLLEEVYAHDASLDELVDGFTQSAEQLPGKRDQVQAAVDELLGRIEEIERRWDKREDMLKGLG